MRMRVKSRRMNTVYHADTLARLDYDHRITAVGSKGLADQRIFMVILIERCKLFASSL